VTCLLPNSDSRLLSAAQVSQTAAPARIRRTEGRWRVFRPNHFTLATSAADFPPTALARRRGIRRLRLDRLQDINNRDIRSPSASAQLYAAGSDRLCSARTGERKSRGSILAVGGWMIATLPRLLPSRGLWQPNEGCGGSRGTWKPASAPCCVSRTNWRARCLADDFQVEQRAELAILFLILISTSSMVASSTLALMSPESETAAS
jgi:hypothetical protein